MKPETVQLLADLNRRFYEEHAEDFADSRPRLHPGARRVLGQVQPGARVLELGCGDGKAGRWLAANAEVELYVGLDASVAMIERARRFTERTEDGGLLRPRDARLPPVSQGPRDAGRPKDGGASRGLRATESVPSSVGRRPSLSFVAADLLSPSWTSHIDTTAFHWLLAFGLFHHIPGFESRARLMREAAAHLAPGGACALSAWQFTRSERLRRRTMPWSAAGLAEGDVEPGDYLLSWERSGRRGLRYVHVLDQRETQRLAGLAGLQIVEAFDSDGESGDLSRYTLLRAADR